MSALDWVTALIGPDKPTIAWWQMGVRGVIVFGVGLAMIRVAGSRTFTKGSPLETVVAIIVGSNLSRALGGTVPFWPMIGVSILIVVLHGLFAHATLRAPWLASLVKRTPVPVVRAGRMDEEAMRREGIDEGDIEASMRERGLLSLDAVELATLERDGKISIVKRAPG